MSDAERITQLERRLRFSQLRAKVLKERLQLWRGFANECLRDPHLSFRAVAERSFQLAKERVFKRHAELFKRLAEDD